MELPNESRNKEVESAIHSLGLNMTFGVSADMLRSGHANALATLNVAESTQFLAVKIQESSVENQEAIKKAFSALIVSNEEVARSNEKYSRSMNYLTLALVVIGLLQLVPIVTSFIFQPAIEIK